MKKLNKLLSITSILSSSLMIMQPALNAQEVSIEHKLIPTAGEHSDTFGRSVSISNDGNTLLIGTPGDGEIIAGAGAAYIYRFVNGDWLESAKLTASDPNEIGGYIEHFGYSVALSSDGNTAIVGARGDGIGQSKTGAAYVYRYNGIDWVEEAILNASDIAGLQNFGISVDITDRGDRIAVGTYGYDAAYVFNNFSGSWVEEAKLTIQSEGSGFFGQQVAISGNRVIAGSLKDDDAAIDAGAAHVFKFNNGSWTEEAKLIPSDGEQYDHFGSTLAIFRNRILVGVPSDDDNGISAGSAYAFRFNNGAWVEHSKILASDGAATDLFGISVDVTFNREVIGAHQDDDVGNDSGSVYVYH